MSYQDMVKEARKKTLKLTQKQQREILNIYKDTITNLSEKAAKAKDGSLTERWAKDYMKQLEEEVKNLQWQLSKSTKKGVLQAGKNAIEPDINLFKQAQKKAGIDLGDHFTDMFSKAPNDILTVMIRGNMYKDGKGLSDRIWGITEGFGKDIEYMVKQGIAEKKSAYELAKDLEQLVKPEARRPWSWGTVYPNLRTKQIDYSAQRLARTSITHAHRESQYRSAERNPFVEAIHWELSGEHYSRQVSRWGEDECDDYATQDNYGLGVGNFPIGEVPLSHPQCLCVTYPVITKTMEQVADELKEWLDGGKNKELDKWFDEHGDYFAGVEPGQKKLLTLQENILKVEQALKQFDTTKVYQNIWVNDVTIADYEQKMGSISAKDSYFLDKIINAQSKAEEEKFIKLREALEDFRLKGEAYLSKKKELADLERKLDELLNGHTDNPYTQARKDKAYWFKDSKTADSIIRTPTGKIWQSLKYEERYSLYKYTSGSGAFNRPLRGYDGSWSNFKGIGKVPLNNEGEGQGIKNITNALKKSKYDFDIWLQRGVESDRGLSGFLGVSEHDLKFGSTEELKQKLIGKVVKDEAFMSTSAVKGGGFSGHIINIYAPKGTEMIYAEPFSAYGHGTKSPNWDGVQKQSSFGYEFEVILNRGYNYKITKVEKSGRRIYIDVDVVK